MGRKCTGCPQRKKNCNPVVLGPDGTINNPEITQIGCPLIDCGGRIPPECRERNTYDINGKICEACPTWKASCKPPIENIAPSDGPRMACPLFNCPGNIPGECTEQQPYEFQGQLCYKCPKWKAGCVPTNRIGGPQKACPLMRCEPLNVPLDCLEDSFFMFEGQRCQGCPGVKQECKQLLNTKPEGGLDRVLTEAIDITTTDGCPPQRCLFIYIPPGCEERESFIYNGKTCYKCPTKRKDCGQEAVRCPPTPCPLIYIPPECEEKQPYLYQGRTCYRCPKRKEGCIANGVGVTKVPMANFNEVVNSVNDVECPPVRCPLILIPKECEQKQPFQYEGRTCYGCPKWRKGCSPGNSNTVDPELNQIACPLFGCPRMDIPKECLEEQPYDFQGKVCYMCPKWRKGCIPKNGNGIPDSGIISGQETPSVVSVDTTVPSVSCPLFKCSRIRIPPECMDEQPFDFSGKTCFKCPRWRLGCVPNNNTTHNGGGCPALVNCPPIEIPSECREETPYIFDGHTCYGCPKFREGCVPVKRIASLDVPCPLMACPSIYIPPECSVEHPYEFKGRTCYKCPTLQTPCIPNEGGIGPRIECPLLDCSDVRIPEECREVKTYKFEGRICNKCPSWKMGCSPSVPVMLTDDKQLPSLKPPIIEVSGFTDVTCPIPKCRRIRIPEECKLVQSYRFQGKTCYKCPIWRPGCHPGSSKLKPTKPTSNDKSTETGSSTPLELTPRRLLMEINMAAISCPRLRCPTIRIPVHCQQQTTYTYKGKTCIGCPTWSSRCDSRNVNMNG